MSKPMSLERTVEAFAGLVVLLSLVLTCFVHPAWMWLTVFVGIILFQQAFSGICPAAIVPKKLFDLRSEAELAAV